MIVGVEEMVGQLMGIMEREIGDVSPSRDDFGTDSIARLNLDSLGLIGFLAAVEEEFRIEWDPDVDIDVLRSFDAMARYVLEQSSDPS
ncbi:MAG TPA: phosphopantetheine-binding protein [Solirubrobacterales bacterium]|nr:phosphopantetheine-binding protein [Solirubrobacterales bacterium]